LTSDLTSLASNLEALTMHVLGVLLLFTAAMVTLPITGYFTSKAYLFEGQKLSIIAVSLFIFTGTLGYKDGSVPAAISAVLIVHVVIGVYVYLAWKEGSQDVQQVYKTD